MSNEAFITSRLSIRRGNLNYRDPSAGGFRADVSASVGPSPGYILVPTAGVQVSFPQLVTPGLVWVQNLDDTNYFELGIKDPGTGLFYPLMELLPGESFPFRFSRNLLEDYTNVGPAPAGMSTTSGPRPTVPPSG